MTRSWLATGVLAGFFGNVLLPLEFFWVQSASMAVGCGSFYLVRCLSFVPRTGQTGCTRVADGWFATDGDAEHWSTQEKRPFGAPDVSAYCASQRAFVARRDWPPVAFQRSEKTVLTLASLIFSGALLFVLFTVMAAIDIDTLARQPYYEDSSLYIKINSTADEDSTYRIMRAAPFSDALREELLAIPGVERIVPLAMLDVTLPDAGFEGAIQSAMPRTLAPRLVEGVLAGKATEEDILPVTINRASPYIERR